MSTKRFARALEAMRSADPRVREDGFDFLREHADAYVDELIAAFTAERDDGHDERDDHELRCWLLELISEARSPRALPVLAEQLDSEDESLRFWAIRGLEMLDTREAYQELSRARSSGWIS
jgi:HEAT repeat protein